MFELTKIKQVAHSRSAMRAIPRLIYIAHMINNLFKKSVCIKHITLYYSPAPSSLCLNFGQFLLPYDKLALQKYLSHDYSEPFHLDARLLRI